MSLCRNPQQHTPRLSLDVSREIAGIYEQLFFPRKLPGWESWVSGLDFPNNSLQDMAPNPLCLLCGGGFSIFPAFSSYPFSSMLHLVAHAATGFSPAGSVGALIVCHWHTAPIFSPWMRKDGKRIRWAGILTRQAKPSQKGQVLKAVRIVFLTRGSNIEKQPCFLASSARSR